LARSGIIIICFLITVQCAEKKMRYPFNWWGMDEAKLWENTSSTDKIAIFRGLKLSPETKAVYEDIYDAVTENTEENDTMYCFPQIPVFYSICGRKDPGTYAKVEWFDVTSDKTLQKDIEIIRKNKPKAILIYNTAEYVYASHEKAFRNGNMSGTRKMREFLYNFIFEWDYTFYGTYKANNNSLSLWIQDHPAASQRKLFFGGDGTKNNPYLISTAEELALFAHQVNNGRSFEGMYVEQTCDIDLSSVKSWTPIGEFGCGNYFYGTYNGAGHLIKNLHIYKPDENVGLFGQLAGRVCNLGVTDSNIRGAYCGVIASHSIGGAEIINCFTDASIRGYRAGAIADNFEGEIINCFAVGNTLGEEYADAVSYGCNSSLINNVYILEENVNSGIIKPKYASDSINISSDAFMRSELLVGNLNFYINESEKDIENTTYIPLVRWNWEPNGYPSFSPPDTDG